jgi:Flp pilus assembly protein TadD
MLLALPAALLGCAQSDPSTASARDPNVVDSSSYGSLMRVADASRAAGDLAGAIGLYRRAAVAKPTAADPHIRLGETLTDMRAYNEAITSFQWALQLDPKSADAMRGWGHALVGLDQLPLARTQYEAALKLNPNDYRTLNGLGVIGDMMGDHVSAQAYYRRGLAIEPNSLALQNNFGLSLALSGNFDESIRILKVLAVNPGATPRNRLNLALAYGLAGQSDEAARASRNDLDEVSIQRNLEYYALLRSMPQQQRSSAIRSNPNYFPRGSGVH